MTVPKTYRGVFITQTSTMQLFWENSKVLKIYIGKSIFFENFAKNELRHIYKSKILLKMLSLFSKFSSTIISKWLFPRFIL